MIADFFEMAGWNSFYLGANTPAHTLVQTLLERKASVLGISVTLTPHMRAVDELIREVRAEPACAGVKIIVGGYPFTIDPGLWRVLGADGSARDAAEVVALAGSLVG
jgi:methanogenic corrinoid protein MtbC1